MVINGNIKIQTSNNTRMPNTQRKIMKHTDHKKLLIISEELIKSPNKDQFLSLFTKEHDIIVIDYNFLQDNGKEVNLRSRTKKIYMKLRPHLGLGYSHMVYIGYKDDGYYLLDLFMNKGIFFDGAVLINCNLNEYPYWNDQRLAPLFKKTPIWNLYSENHPECRKQGLNNFVLPTKYSPQFNSRYALESYGVIVYGVYGKLSLLEPAGNIQMLSNLG